MKPALYTLVLLPFFLLASCGGGGGTTNLGTPCKGCSPGSSNPYTAPAGIYKGTAGAGKNRQYLAVNLKKSSQSFYWFYSAPGGTIASGVEGFLSGQLKFSGGNLNPTTLINYELTSGNPPPPINGPDKIQGGDYTNDLRVTLKQDGGTINKASLVLHQESMSNTLTQRTYTGTSKSYVAAPPSANNPYNTKLTINSGGTFTGTANSGTCNFTGTWTNSSTKNVFLVTVHTATGDTGQCMGNPNMQANGIAVMDGNTGKLYIAVSNTIQTAAIFVGS